MTSKQKLTLSKTRTVGLRVSCLMARMIQANWMRSSPSSSARSMSCKHSWMTSSLSRMIKKPESELCLKDIIFALKDFRNAIAHNGVIVDVRFKSGSINTGVAQLLKQETGVGKIDFTDITDYVILLVYLMRGMGFTKTECKQLVAGYESVEWSQ